MGSGRFGAVRGDVLRLFEGDSVAGLGDGDLLERFATRRDEAAFEGLVTRLGPMVLGVCRRMLADAHDVEDAFQATFLVLVRRAGSIRDRDLVAPWLYGVATRVARRARADAARRAARERVAVVPEAREEVAEVDSGWPELRALIDEEIGRLPEDHRRLVVLCDVEGLTREEAALRLGWSLNMVRGRLERARGRLRGRLARRGVAPSGAWAALVVAPPAPPAALVAATVRLAMAFSVGRVGMGLASASAVALSRGVLRMMMFSKLKIGLAVLLSTGFVAAGSGLIAAQGPGDKPTGKVVDAAPPADQNPAPAPGDLASLGKSRIEMARKRWETQLAFYNEGRITIDRLLNASQTLLDAQLDATDAPEARLGLIKAHLERIKEIEKRELAELEVGRATNADVEEVQTHRLDVEFRLAKEAAAAGRKPATVPPPAAPKAADRPSLDKADRDRERVEIARRLYDEARKLRLSDQISTEEVLEAAITLAKAEESSARSRADRVTAIQTHVDLLKELVANKEKLAKLAQVSRSEVDRARLRLLDAESHLSDVSTGTPDETGEGVAPTPGGPAPVPGPGVSRPAEVRAPSRLAAVIEVFNAEALNTPAGRGQPPLTEDEVVAAIRYFEPPQDAPVADPLLAEFRKVAETRQLPRGAMFETLQLMDPGGDFLFEGWWVRIEMPKADGGTYAFPIRSRVLRSVPLEEALAHAEARLDPGKLIYRKGIPAGRKVQQERVESLKARIERRDKKPSGGVIPF